MSIKMMYSIKMNIDQETIPLLSSLTHRRAWWFSGKFVALRPQGCRFEPHSSRHVGTLGKSFTRSCCITWCVALLHGCLSVKFDSCINLLSSIYTLLVNILRCVRLYIETKITLFYIIAFICA